MEVTCILETYLVCTCVISYFCPISSNLFCLSSSENTLFTHLKLWIIHLLVSIFCTPAETRACNLLLDMGGSVTYKAEFITATISGWALGTVIVFMCLISLAIFRCHLGRPHLSSISLWIRSTSYLRLPEISTWDWTCAEPQHAAVLYLILKD